MQNVLFIIISLLAVVLFFGGALFLADWILSRIARNK